MYILSQIAVIDCSDKDGSSFPLSYSIFPQDYFVITGSGDLQVNRGTQNVTHLLKKMKNKIKIAMPGTRTTTQLKKIRFVICNDFKIKKSWIEASTVDEYLEYLEYLEDTCMKSTCTCRSLTKLFEN